MFIIPERHKGLLGRQEFFCPVILSEAKDPFLLGQDASLALSMTEGAEAFHDDRESGNAGFLNSVFSHD